MASNAQTISNLVEGRRKRRAKKAGERIVLAMRHAGLSSGQLERLLLSDRRRNREAGIVDRWIAGERPISEVDVLAIARLCKVDVRWLATGAHSPAALAAIEKLAAVFEAARDSISPELAALAREVTLLAREPSRGKGFCRYCNCAFDTPCDGGCAWVDEEETICTACLLTAEDR
jgi:hypothetical protein